MYHDIFPIYGHTNFVAKMIWIKYVEYINITKQFEVSRDA